MPDRTNTVRAADHLVDQLVAQGTNAVFGVPGESYLPVLDAFHGREDTIRFITCRHESGAAMAADAHARMTGRPGICFVTRGPGATNASAGVHIAFQDSVPLVLFIGQVARNMVEREAFQEIDYRRMYGQMAKWVAEIDDPSRIQEYVSRAFRTALSGRPGPVVLSLPEDMLYDPITPPAPPARAETPRFLPAAAQMDDLKSRIASAKHPLVMAGGGGWTRKGIEAMERFAETQGMPIAVSLRSQGLMNNDHPNYVGHFGIGPTAYLADALKKTDLLVAIGPRLGEMTTGGYALLEPPVPALDLVHVLPEGEELGRVYEPALSLVSDTQSFCLKLAEWDTIAPDRFAPLTADLRSAYEAFNAPSSIADDPLAPFYAYLTETLPADAIVCNGAGNYAAWLHRFYRYRAPGSQLAPTSGSMGYGLPAAVGAAIAAPEREIVAIAGDGCFLMTSQEMATAVHHKLNLTVIVMNNSRYGTIRAHQEREFPDRVLGTDLTNPDFCAFAKSFGAQAYLAHDLTSFEKAFSAAREESGVKLIEVQTDPKLISPGKWLR